MLLLTYPLPLDLHVLSLPLAFILSQDQTLHCIYYKLLAPVTLYSIFPKELRSLCISTKIIVLLNYAACLSIIFNELSIFPPRSGTGFDRPSRLGPQRY